MSHYTVAVFTKDLDQDIDDLLAPYNENLFVEPHVSLTKEQLIQRERDTMQSCFNTRYADWQKNKEEYEKHCRHPEHIDYLKRLPELMKRSDDELYTAAIRDYEPEEITAEGGVLSCYNPSSKWDWYVIGGRWHGMLIMKEGATGEQGEPAYMMEQSENCDIAKVADVDFDAMQKCCLERLVPYEKAMREGFFNEEYQRQRYPSEEEYIRRETSFQTFAVVTPDGIWHAPGEMGWFGLDSSTPEAEREWDHIYYDRFIKPAIENGWYITIVDCHI